MFVIEPSELYERLKKKDFILVDIRTQEEWDQGYIEGTDFFIDFYQSDFFDKFKNVPQDKEIILYCHAAHRSLYALYMLSSQGTQNVGHLIGGIEERVLQGYDII